MSSPVQWQDAASMIQSPVRSGASVVRTSTSWTLRHMRRSTDSRISLPTQSVIQWPQIDEETLDGFKELDRENLRSLDSLACNYLKIDSTDSAHGVCSLACSCALSSLVPLPATYLGVAPGFASEYRMERPTQNTTNSQEGNSSWMP
jgi:hypothetical protein